MSKLAGVLAEVSSYTELTAALRARADELKFSGKALDAISGLADGYFQKLIGPIPQRTLGPGMLDAVLGTLCVKLAVIHDAEALERLQRAIAAPKQPGSALDGVVERDETRVRKPPAVITYTSITYKKMAKKGGKARAEKLSAKQRKAIASLGGQARIAKLSSQAIAESCSKAAQAKWARIRAKQKEVEANPVSEGDLDGLERKIRT